MAHLVVVVAHGSRGGSFGSCDGSFWSCGGSFGSRGGSMVATPDSKPTVWSSKSGYLPSLQWTASH